jgi:hypothetical protein
MLTGSLIQFSKGQDQCGCSGDRGHSETQPLAEHRHPLCDYARSAVDSASKLAIATSVSRRRFQSCSRFHVGALAQLAVGDCPTPGLLPVSKAILPRGVANAAPRRRRVGES